MKLYGVFKEINKEEFDQFYNIRLEHLSWELLDNKVYNNIDSALLMAHELNRNTEDRYCVNPLELITND